MPPCLDIYGLTKLRELDLIERFLGAYVDREACEDRGDEELMMLKVTASPSITNADGSDSYEWEPAKTLSSVVRRGLDHPRRCFTVYLTPREANIDQVILSFTADDQLVLGLSIDGTDIRDVDDLRATGLLTAIAHSYGCHLGLIVVERPPPSDETSFLAEASNPYAVHFADFRGRRGEA